MATHSGGLWYVGVAHSSEGRTCTANCIMLAQNLHFPYRFQGRFCKLLLYRVIFNRKSGNDCAVRSIAWHRNTHTQTRRYYRALWLEPSAAPILTHYRSSRWLSLRLGPKLQPLQSRQRTRSAHTSAQRACVRRKMSSAYTWLVSRPVSS
jgi:hypothetical protein